MKKSAYILTVTLNSAIDKISVVSDLKIGKDLRVEKMELSAGGKGINVARVLNQLKIPTLATGFMGQNSNHFFQQELAAQKIPHDFVLVAGDVRTNLTIIDPITNRTTRLLENGPRVSTKEIALFKKKYRSLLKNAYAVVLSGRNTCGATDSLYADLIGIANKAGVRTILDTSGQPLALGIKKKPFMIKPNKEEVAEILGRKIRSHAGMIEALGYFWKMGVQIVAITDGSKGAYLFDGKEIIWLKVPQVEGSHTVGCGDAFVAGLIAGFYQGKSFDDSVRLAGACGVSNAMIMQPGNIENKKMNQYLKLVQIIKFSLK